ncbi:MAG: SsrA-binding protein SmpB [Clostridia bacterium]|jgi:SsrA-binding protein|nr:SsrA-binding protein SmpB [Clostridia bacterium]MBQ1942791.1 SsrA-binding protein SmpB [Clostridia bacterium]
MAKEREITVNRKAGFNYFIEERYEAGIQLEGAEVKSLRMGNANLSDSFCFIRNGEVVLKNAHIAVYDKAGAYNSKDAKRDRRLLLHKSEIHKIVGKVNEKGFTLVPLKLYFKDALVKVEVALCRGKQTVDKKNTLKERDLNRDSQRQLKEYSR